MGRYAQMCKPVRVSVSLCSTLTMYSTLDIDPVERTPQQALCFVLDQHACVLAIRPFAVRLDRQTKHSFYCSDEACLLRGLPKLHLSTSASFGIDC